MQAIDSTMGIVPSTVAIDTDNISVHEIRNQQLLTIKNLLWFASYHLQS